MGYIENIRKLVGHYPVFMPASGCIIVKDNKVLLQKRVDNGKWATHGGSLELGEDFEDALKREVKEELNINIKDPKLFKFYSGEKEHHIYPNGDEVYGVSAFYIVTDYDGEFKLDANEVVELKWFDINDLPKEIHGPDVQALAEMIEYLKNK